MKAYREWLPGDGYEATGSLGGSFYSDDIEDYYLTPHELGYWPFVRFDHDFVGREALEKMGDEPRAAQGHARLERRGRRAPRSARCSSGATPRSTSTCRSRTTRRGRTTRSLRDGEMVGVSTFSGYSYNERSMLSLPMVDPEVELGSEVTLVWGEEDGGSSKPVVERHVQTELRAIVSPAPYSEMARRRTRTVGGRRRGSPEASRARSTGVSVGGQGLVS